MQSDLHAFGLQRAGDRQEDGGEEASEPGGEEEGAGGAAGHGLREQEVGSGTFGTGLWEGLRVEMFCSSGSTASNLSKQSNLSPVEYRAFTSDWG